MKVVLNRDFSAAHRLADDPTPCQRIHGHNYEVTVEIETDGVGWFVVPLAVLKNVVDQYDHRLIIHTDDPFLRWINSSAAHSNFRWDQAWIAEVPCIPTTENLAQHIAEQIATETWAWGDEHYREPATEVYVNVWLRETKSIMARGVASKRPS